MIKRFFLLVSIAVLVIACKTSQPTSTPYIYASPILTTIDLTNVKDDKIKVVYNPNNITQDTLLFNFPAIIPGTYTIANYGEFIENLTAHAKDGTLLHIKKHTTNQWIIFDAKKLDKISYWVNDTFDDEQNHTIFSPTGSSYEKDKLFLLNLHGLIGYYDDSKLRKHTVLIQYPSTLLGTTDSVSEENSKLPYKIDKLLFKTYASLVDTPLMYQAYASEKFTIDDMDVFLNTYSPKMRHTAKTIRPELERVLKAQKNFLGDFKIPTHYAILLYLSSASKNDARGFGALEHHNATLAVLPESLSSDNLNATLADIISHEFFHILTPLHLHSEEIHNYNYQKPEMSKHLWLYEGMTEYFSMLFQIHQGLILKEDFYARITEKINASVQYDSYSFTELSKNILKEPYKSNYPNVYQKGALLSLCIDLIMREESKGAYGVLDLLKNLISLYGDNKPFNDQELFTAIETLSYPSIATFLANSVAGNTSIDYNFYLNKAGLELSQKQVATSYFIHETQPLLEVDLATKEIRFTTNSPLNSFLQTLGIKGHDVLLSIDGKKYTSSNFYEIFADSNRWIAGQTKTFIIRRGSKNITLTAITNTPTTAKTVIKQIENPSQLQQDVFKNWINE
ncbi:peptidase M61 [Aquimarina sp. W85]|uniref:M61 family metallopeptidase n=1 Tax=Aquimarina rhodophyticola TaxID=3342246 RepID=UPI003672672F